MHPCVIVYLVGVQWLFYMACPSPLIWALVERARSVTLNMLVARQQIVAWRHWCLGLMLDDFIVSLRAWLMCTVSTLTYTTDIIMAQKLECQNDVMCIQMPCISACLYRYVVCHCHLCMPLTLYNLSTLHLLCAYVTMSRQSVYITYHLCPSLIAVNAIDTL